MRKLKLDLDALDVESFSPSPGPPRRAGTVRARVEEGDPETLFEIDGALWTLWSCPVGPTEGTCIGPTYCCPPTWRPTCNPTCNATCFEMDCTL